MAALDNGGDTLLTARHGRHIVATVVAALRVRAQRTPLRGFASELATQGQPALTKLLHRKKCCCAFGNAVQSAMKLESGGLPLVTTSGITVNMTPAHPGDLVRTEVIEELGLNVTKAAEILGVRRATLSDL